MRSKPATSVGIAVLSAVVTTWALACRFDVDEFRPPSVRPDSAAPDGATDAPIDTTTIDSDAKVDSILPPDTSTETTSETSTVDSADTTPLDVPDTGPPEPEIGCTAVGPVGMRCIPSTTFTLGASNTTACPDTGCAQEKPEVSVKVSQFFIDDKEVTVGRFRAWWNMSPRPWPASGSTFFTSASRDLKWRNTWPTMPTEPPKTGCTWLGATDASNDDKPINCVDWYTALAFCVSEGKRLPTEAEWELVASGGQERLFPWSPPGSDNGAFTDTDVTCVHAHRASCPPTTTADESTIWGRARYGTWNLAGGFAEWVIDGHASSYGGVTAGSIDPVGDPTTTAGRLTRGGSYLSPARDLRATARPAAPVPATTPDAQIGFRCAKRL